MAENRCSCTSNSLQGISHCKESVCIDTYRVLDSCRDKDCFENVRVYLTEIGQEIVNHTDTIRTKCAHIIRTCINVEPVQFNRGFYQITIRFYVKVVFEACVNMSRAQEFEGVAVVEKRVILYGSEGCVNIYRSGINDDICCTENSAAVYTTNMPVATVEVAEPVVLGAKIVEANKCNFTPCCICSCDCIPENVQLCFNGNLCDSDERNLYVSLGFFSIVRIERPAQYLVNVAEYCIPDKECVIGDDDDPCHLFKNMAFPINEFYPPSLSNNGADCNMCKKK